MGFPIEIRHAKNLKSLHQPGFGTLCGCKIFQKTKRILNKVDDLNRENGHGYHVLTCDNLKYK